MVDNSLWKIVFGFMLVVALLVFAGALALSDADIFNIERARATAAQIESQTAYNAQRGQIDLTIYPQLAWERSQAQIRLIHAQTERDQATIAEEVRVMQAENDRVLAARTRFDAVKTWFGVVASGGVLVVALYVLLMVAHRAVDRLLPPRPAMAAAPAATPWPPRAHSGNIDAPSNSADTAFGNMWNDPDFRAWMRQRARRQEMAELAEKAAARPAAHEELPAQANGGHSHVPPVKERVW